MPGLRGLSRGGAGTRGSPACPRSSSRSGWWWCGSGKRAAAASWPPPAPPARWHRHLQGVRGGVRGLGEPPNNFFPPHTHSLMAMCTESSGCAAVSAQMWRLCTASTPPTASSVSCTALKSMPLGVPGGGSHRMGWVGRAHSTHGWFSPPHRPRRVPTLHEDEKDVAEDGQRCPQHQGGEEEGADGIHELVLGLGEAAKAEIPPPVPPPASKSPSESIPSISPPCAARDGQATVPVSPSRASPWPPAPPPP